MAAEADGEAAPAEQHAAALPLLQILGVLLDQHWVEVRIVSETGSSQRSHRLRGGLHRMRIVQVDAIDTIAQLSWSLYRGVKKLKLRRRMVRKHGFPAHSRFRCVFFLLLLVDAGLLLTSGWICALCVQLLEVVRKCPAAGRRTPPRYTLVDVLSAGLLCSCLGNLNIEV